MRIALFHNLPSGGAKRHTREQAKELARRGHQLVELAPSTADWDFCALAPFVTEQRRFQLDPIQPIQRRLPLLTPYLHALQGILMLQRTNRLNKTIASEIDSAPFDLVFAKDCRYMPSPFLLRHLTTSSVFQCHHVQRPAVKQMQDGHDVPASLSERVKQRYYAPAHALFRSIYARAEDRNIRRATHVITNSGYSQRALQARHAVSPAVVYPGIDTTLFRPLQIEKRDYVLSVGTLHYLKGFRFLLSTLALIDRAHRPPLFIASNTIYPEEETLLRAMARQLEVELYIETITNDQRMVQVYNQAQVLVYAPIEEALGLVPLEAMACGTPVVAVAEGGVSETVPDGRAGWLVDRDPTTFAERLAALLGDKTTRTLMGETGTEYIRDGWTWGRAVDRLEAEFAKAIS